jgi:hypothetical protein
LVVVKPRDDLRAVLDGSIESAGQQQARAAFAAAAACSCWPAAAGPRSMAASCFVMISLRNAVPSFTRLENGMLEDLTPPPAGCISHDPGHKWTHLDPAHFA